MNLLLDFKSIITEYWPLFTCAVILIILIVVLVVLKTTSKKTEENPDKQENEKIAETKSVKEQNIEEPKKEPAKKIEKAEKTTTTETKPAKENATTVETETKKVVKKTTKKEKTEEPEIEEPKIEEPAKDDTTNADAGTVQDDLKEVKNQKYMIIYDKENKEWVVKKTNSQRASKRCKTKKEAMEYAQKWADNQDLNLTIKKKDGKFQKKENAGK